MRMPRCDDLEFGKGWIGNEALVRIDVNFCGMIYSDKPRLVEIVDLLHRFRKSKAETTVARLHAPAVNFDVLVRIWQIALMGTNPMAEYGRTNHVADQFVAAAIPGKQYRTRASAAVNFKQLMRLVRRKIDLVLIHAGRPEEPHNVGSRLLPKSGDDFVRPLR